MICNTFREALPNWGEKIRSFIVDRGMGTGPVLPTGLVLLVAHSFFWATTWFMNYWTAAWLGERHPRLTLPDRCIPDVPIATCNRLMEQLSIAQTRAIHHYEIGRDFQVWEFGFLATSYWSGSMMALVLFVAIKKGYDDLGAWGKGMLLGLTCSAAFFGGFPSLMRLDQNINQNLNAYNTYDGTANEIRTYMASGQAITGNHVDGASFLHRVDALLATFPASRIQLDAESVDLGGSRFMDLSKKIEGDLGVDAPE